MGLVSNGLEFFLLTVGLAGLALAFATNRRHRIYLTNYRVLVSRCSLIGAIPTWACMHYYEISNAIENKFLGRNRISLVTDEGDSQLVLSGLDSKVSEEVRAVVLAQMSKAT